MNTTYQAIILDISLSQIMRVLRELTFIIIIIVIVIVKPAQC